MFKKAAIIFSALIFAILFAVPGVLADDVETIVHVAEQVSIDSNGKCGGDHGDVFSDCNSQYFTASGPGGCWAKLPEFSYVDGCLLWDAGQKAEFTSKIFVEKEAVGALRIWTAHHGGNTQENERAEVYVNGVYVGTTEDNYCNHDSEPECEAVGPFAETINHNIKFKAGINEIRFVAVEDGDSFAIHKYGIAANYVDGENNNPNNPEDDSPICDIGFDPKTINFGETTIVNLETENARSFRYVCDGDIGSGEFANIPKGYELTSEVTPTGTQKCTIKVFEKPNFKGEKGTCQAKIKVTDTPKGFIDLEVENQVFEITDEYVQIDLFSYTRYELVDVDSIEYKILDGGNKDVMQCDVDNIDLECVLKGLGKTTIEVRVTARDLNGAIVYDDDAFITFVIEEGQEFLSLDIEDRTVEEDSGLHKGLVNLHVDTAYTGNKDDLVYTFVDQTHTEVIECFIIDNKLDCETKLNQNGVSTVTVKVTDGSLTVTDSFDITVTPLNDSPQIEFIGGSICRGQATSFEVDVSDADGDIQSVEWDFGDGSNPVLGSKVKHTYKKEGDYKIEVVVIGDDEEKVLLTQEVTANNCDVKHDISIQSAWADTGLGSYGEAEAGDYVDVYVKVKNLGDGTERVGLQVSMPEYGLIDALPSFEIKELQGTWRILTFKLPQDIGVGEHVIRVEASSKNVRDVRYLTFGVI